MAEKQSVPDPRSASPVRRRRPRRALGVEGIEGILGRLNMVRQVSQNQWSACCPAHADSAPSLTVSEAEDGRSCSIATPAARSRRSSKS